MVLLGPTMQSSWCLRRLQATAAVAGESSLCQHRWHMVVVRACMKCHIVDVAVSRDAGQDQLPHLSRCWCKFVSSCRGGVQLQHMKLLRACMQCFGGNKRCWGKHIWASVCELLVFVPLLSTAEEYVHPNLQSVAERLDAAGRSTCLYA